MKITHIRFWAPNAAAVEAQVGHRRHSLARLGNGWWSADVEGFGTLDYGFVLDGTGPFPDPRSPWQPHGVHGLSRPVDHAAFPWTDQRWQAPPLSSAVFYELHIGTFTPEGTFDAAARKLGHLRELGVTHVEFMPVCEFSGPWGWGYDGVDLYAPHDAYGGPDGLKRLINACHEAGLAAVLDVVYNHLGPSGNYLSRFGPYFNPRHHTPWGEAVNLDGPASPEVRRFFCDNALMWLRDYHFDGLRLDAVHALVDTSAVHFLEQLASEVRRLEAVLGRHLALIAESDLNDPRVIRPPELGGYGIHAQWNDDFHHALHSVLTGERNGYYSDFGSLDQLVKAVTRGFVYDGCYSGFRDRHHGRPLDGISGRQLVACLQNHDQVGNRARGDRASHLLNPGRLKTGAAVLMTAPFIPLLFQGEEWGASTPFMYFTQHEDPALAHAVSAGRRGEFIEFGWVPEEVPDPQARATFEGSKLKWAERDSPAAAGLLAWYSSLIRLRRSVPALSDGRMDKVRARADSGILEMRRGPVRLVANLGPKPVALAAGDNETVLLCSDPLDRELPPDSVALLGLSQDAGVRAWLSRSAASR
ncbi:MAG TPA: malto-oligosyltrehalose trehalohydrolase [Bryobacteraceae bacterium]|nr:malto-oligosyltrehalose trehalohydrolase [Bryobacteraceae bacterium]